MKIVHVTNWYIPKMSYQENFLPYEQKLLGHDVEIITSDRFPGYIGNNQNINKVLGKRIITSGVFCDNIKIHRLRTLIEIKDGDQLITWGLKNKLRELNPDIVHAHNVFSLLTLQVIIYSKKFGYKVYVDDHSHEVNFNVDNWLKKIYLSLVKIFYKHYDRRVSCFIPITYSSKKIIQATLSIPDDKIELLYLGADIKKFYSSQELRKNGRNELGIDNNEQLVITTGKLHKNKDIDILISAFKGLIQDYPHIKLLIIGSGVESYMKNLYELTGDLLNKNIFFKEFVPNSELPKYYNAADIGVWPGDPTITVIEAIATGLPIIIPENDSAYEHLLINNAAIGYKRRDIESLSNKLYSLLTDNNALQSLKDHSMVLSANCLSWQEIAKESIRIYQKYSIKVL